MQQIFLLVGITIIIVAALFIVFIIAMMRIFQKAGRPQWEALIPFYGNWRLSEISGNPGWLGLVAVILYQGNNPLIHATIFADTPPDILYIITVLSYISSIVMIYILVKLAIKFNKSIPFIVFFIVLLAPIGIFILGYGKDQYNGANPTNNGNGYLPNMTGYAPTPTPMPVSAQQPDLVQNNNQDPNMTAQVSQQPITQNTTTPDQNQNIDSSNDTSSPTQPTQS